MAVAVAAVLTLVWTWVVPAVTGGIQSVLAVATKPWVELRIARHEGEHVGALKQAIEPVQMQIHDLVLWKLYTDLRRVRRSIVALEEKQTTKSGLSSADKIALADLLDEEKKLKAKYDLEREAKK